MKPKIITLFGNYHIIKNKSDEYDLINIVYNSSLGQPILKSMPEAFMTIVVNSEKELRQHVEFLCKMYHVIDIVSFTDSNDGVLLATDLSNMHLTNSNPINSIEVLNNKIGFRRFLRNMNLKTIPFTEITFSDPEVESKVCKFFENIKGPGILKPVAGQGSLLVNKVNNIADVMKVISKNKNTPFILEQYIVGKEVSVETLHINGFTQVIGITEKIIAKDLDIQLNNPFIEIGHIFPCKKISRDVETEIRVLVQNLFSKLEIKRGIGHTEIMITKEGPVFIESHLRPGGDFIPRLIELSTGINLIKEYFKSLSIDNNLENIKYKYNAAIRFIVPKKGLVSKIVTPSIKEEEKDFYLDRVKVKFNKGDNIGEITNTFDRNYGEVILFSSENDIESKINEYLNCFEISYSKEVGKDNEK